MAIRYGQDRRQQIIFPPSIDEYISADNPVRVYDEFVEALDFDELGIDLQERKIGCSRYDPRAMLKLLLFGYSYGVNSSRKLERETHNNLAFIWLMKNLKPDHKTIAEFRRKNKPALKKALSQCARLCLRLDLVEGNILFVDSTKICANAGKSRQHSKKWYKKQLGKVDKRIDQLLERCEEVDLGEQGSGSWVKMPKELTEQKCRKEAIQQALAEFEKRGEKTKSGKDRLVNEVDPESSPMKSPRGSHPSFSVQSVVDDKNGLIVSVDAVNDANDANQMSDQVRAAEANLDKKCKIACADAGYSNVMDLAKIESGERAVIVPTSAQASQKPPKPFGKPAFAYDKDSDCYRCPQGHRLVFRGTQGKEKRHYRIEKPALCRNCPYFGECTKSRQGRSIMRHVLEEVREQIEKRYEQPEAREIYDRRKSRVEHPFGYMKKNLGFRQFNLRGRQGALAEGSILGIVFNLSRMINLLGGPQAIKAKMASI